MNALDEHIDNTDWEGLSQLICEAVEVTMSKMTREELVELCKWNHG